MIVAIFIHVAVSTLFAYIASCVTASLNPGISLLSLTVGTAVAWKMARHFKADSCDLVPMRFSESVAGWIEGFLFIFVLYAGFRHFAWLIFDVSGQIKTLSANNFGDLPLHLNYIRQFSLGAAFPPVNPEFPTDALRYPIGIDLYSALWESLRVPTSSHFFVVGMVALFASLVTLRAFGGWLAIGGLFLNGGLLTLSENGLKVAAPDKFGVEFGWKNIFLTVFITQRGMLFAIPVGLLLLLFMRRAIDQAGSEFKKIHFISFGFLWGVLALFHLHSFFAVSLLLAGLASIGGRKGLTAFAKLLVSAVPTATFFVLYSTGLLQKASVMHWQLGWMKNEKGFVSFAFLNFGVWPVFLVLMLGLLIFAKSQFEKGDRNRLLFSWILGAALFSLFMNLMFATWAWDNIKVLIWPYLLLLAISSRVLGAYFSKGPLALTQTILATILLAPGFSQILPTLSRVDSALGLYTIAEIARTEGALKSLSPNAVIVATQSHNHPLTYLGRIRSLGYDGHLWSHGLEYGKEAADQKILLSGANGWREAAARLRATHIFWGPLERVAYGEVPANIKAALKNVSSVAGYEVYDLR